MLQQAMSERGSTREVAHGCYMSRTQARYVLAERARVQLAKLILAEQTSWLSAV